MRAYNVESIKTRLRGWKANGSLRAAAHGAGLAVLLAAGTVWTLNSAKPEFGSPGSLIQMPAAIVKAAPAPASPNAAAEQAPVKVTGLAFSIGQVLRRYTRDGNLADRIANALVVEGRRKNIDPVLLVGVLLTENAKLQPRAQSNVRATGLMQVMPFHRGKWKDCPSSDLGHVETNICYGTSILADFIKRKPNMRAALQGYNGCVRGTNTPHCHTYTGKVMKFASLTSRQLRAVDSRRADAGIGSYRTASSE